MRRLIAVLLIVFARDAAAADCGKWIQAAAGDYCHKLWTSAGLTESAFKAINSELDCDKLMLGDWVCVHGTELGQCEEAVTVQRGETCWSLGRANGGMDEQRLRALNVGLVCEQLQVGQSLCVRRAAAAATPVAKPGSVVSSPPPPPPTTTTTTEPTVTERPRVQLPATPALPN